MLLLSVFLVGWITPNVKTTFMPDIETPIIGQHTRIRPLAAVIGSVAIGDHVYVAPAASVRGDEGQHIHIGHESNVQDGVVLHGLETFEGDHELSENEVEVDGKKYSVYVGNRVSSLINRRCMDRPKSATTRSWACRRSSSGQSRAIMWSSSLAPSSSASKSPRPLCAGPPHHYQTGPSQYPPAD
ncbi:hypothetical protein ACO9S2_15260 [Nitrospira sp. NS4]|uniref:hypothetical protein n=1 Tax=Nitrospira sp. NS4 TaxID=3414498 RepID=UPI003C306709